MPIILVPQGAEYQAVCRGLRGVANPPTVLAIPACPEPVRRYLANLPQVDLAGQSHVLVMGLCGGLTSHLNVGNVVLYEKCYFHANPAPLLCDRPLNVSLQAKLGSNTLVRAVTCDRIVASVVEKQGLATDADVVDMEGYPILEFFNQIGIPVAMLRVVSDDCQHDLPNLVAAFNTDGAMRPLPLAVGMIRQPIAASRLIRGSLNGLRVLQKLPPMIFA